MHVLRVPRSPRLVRRARRPLRLPASFLPLTRPGAAGNLPRELSRFVGRQAEVDELAQALRASGLITLVGVGGVGKTRLALRTAAAIRHNYAHGAWLVQLAPIVHSADVASTVAAALGVRERPGSDPLDTLRLVLRRRQLLLVLDNCEHVLEASAEVAAALLQDCEDLTVLATSRAALGVAGEAIRLVSPLGVPRPGEAVERLFDSEAVQLLLARIKALDPTFDLTPRTSILAADICRGLAGLPLGIELAAARTKTMTLGEIAAHLRDPLGLLTVGPRTAPPRQRTLRATIDWGYELLTEAERAFARRASIFAGGLTVDSARAVFGDQEYGPADILNLLDSLVAHSFLNADTQQEHARFRMLEPIRQYCLERLEQSAESVTVRERHRDWCLAQVTDAPPEGFDLAHIARIEGEIDNLRSALRWVTETRQVSAATRLALGMASFWLVRGSFAEGRAALSAVLDLAPGGTLPEDFPHVGTWASILAANQGDYTDAETYLRTALSLAETTGNAYAEVFAYNQLGWIALLRGDPGRARAINEQALSQLAPRSGLAQVVRLHLAKDNIELGNRARTAELLDSLLEAPHSRLLDGRALSVRALLAEQARDYAGAEQLLDRAIDFERSIGDVPGLIESLTHQSVVALARGDRQRAADVLAEALEIASLYGNKMRLAALLEALAELVASSQPAACVRLAAAAEQLRTSLGAAPVLSEQARIGPSMETAKRRVGEQAYAATWLEAQSIPLDTTLGDARELVRSLAPHVARPTGDDPLSDREREVAILVARGCSNRQIADQLVISPKTAETHVSHVLNKLGLTSRVQIATWGLRHGVVPQATED